jgi:CO/xanthine dehydrogenase Mo-binding subunit
MGSALTEHLQMRDGRVLTPHVSSYLLPTTLDMPTEVYPVLLALADPNGPFGARGWPKWRWCRLRPPSPPPFTTPRGYG